MAAPAAEADSSKGVPPRDYAAFIEQIELTALWLRSARLANHHGAMTPEKAVFEVDRHAEWEAREGGFTAFHAYAVPIKSADTTLADVEVTFALDFDSKEPMTTAIFDIFQEVNLPVNTWPYLREFLATTLGRFNWAPFALPTFKVGARPARRQRRTRSTATDTSARGAPEP